MNDYCGFVFQGAKYTPDDGFLGDCYDSDCGWSYVMMGEPGDDDWKFCPACGKEIKEEDHVQGR